MKVAMRTCAGMVQLVEEKAKEDSTSQNSRFGWPVGPSEALGSHGKIIVALVVSDVQQLAHSWLLVDYSWLTVGSLTVGFRLVQSRLTVGSRVAHIIVAVFVTDV